MTGGDPEHTPRPDGPPCQVSHPPLILCPAPAPPPAGAAVALQALAPGLSGAQLTSALEFLLSRCLADGNSVIREGMVAAGVAIVDAHGGANSEAMLPLFESYLDKQVRSKVSVEELNKVRAWGMPERATMDAKAGAVRSPFWTRGGGLRGRGAEGGGAATLLHPIRTLSSRPASITLN